MKVIYEAEDGTKFANINECKKYEKRLIMSERLEKICQNRDMCWFVIIKNWDDIVEILDPERSSMNLLELMMLREGVAAISPIVNSLPEHEMREIWGAWDKARNEAKINFTKERPIS